LSGVKGRHNQTDQLPASLRDVAFSRSDVKYRDVSYGLLAMGIRDRSTSPQSPWQNGYAERLGRETNLLQLNEFTAATC